MKWGFERRRLAQAVMVALATTTGIDTALAATDDPFLDLNLKEVLNLEITSVSKKPQTVSQAAAAIFVITGDDIRRSGAITIPDALRMAPGIEIAQINANTWAVSARGANGRFTNKLLVLIDGRSVYTPTFSGVYWDVQDSVLADVDRIEVIRGPGAALWGANAVNGVINIITKSVGATQGGIVNVTAGSEEKGTASVRYGGKLGEVGHWRAYAKGFDRDESIVSATGDDGPDHWRQQRAGFRTDFSPGARDSVTVQGDAYAGRAGEINLLNLSAPPYATAMGITQKVSGGHLLGRWQRDLSDTDSFTLQAYFDHTRRDWPAHLDERRDTYDLDFQYRSRRHAGHDLVFGLGYRVSRDRMAPSVSGIPSTTLQYAGFHPSSYEQRLISAFVQDDITLVPEHLILTLGAKFEHNGFTGVEYQPNLRLLWTPAEPTTLWGSIARAVRTPSRIDHNGEVFQSSFAPLSIPNPTPLPGLLIATGAVDSETVVAYEAGWKQRVAPDLSVDLAVFYNDYRNLRTGRFIDPVCMPSRLPVAAGCFLLPGQTHVLLPSPIGNQAHGWSHGIELATDWRARPGLRFQLAISQFDMVVHEKGNAFSTDLGGSAPHLQGSLRMAWNPRADVDFDAWLRRVGRLAEVADGISIPAYTQMDLRLAWRPTKSLELALVGRNLLDSRHPEFISELADGPLMEVQRSVFGQLTLRF